MTDFTRWSRESLESLAGELIQQNLAQRATIDELRTDVGGISDAVCRKMTPEEYAREYRKYGKHFAVSVQIVEGCQEVWVCMGSPEIIKRATELGRDNVDHPVREKEAEMGNDKTENLVGSHCYGVVTHQQQEILYAVSRMPRGFIKLRRDELIADYTHLLIPRQAIEAFHVMIGLVAEDAVSDKGRVCFRHFRDRDGYSAFG